MSKTLCAAQISILYAAPRMMRIQRALSECACTLHMAAPSELGSWALMAAPLDICLLDLDALEASGGLHTVQNARLDVPLVLLTREVKRQQQDFCQHIGAMALLSEDVDPEGLCASLRLWVARDQEMKALRNSETRLQNALTTSRCVSHAVGMLAERHQLPVNEAFQLLRSHARLARKRIVDLAKEIIPQNAFS